MLHILIGEDDFSLRQALEEIKKSIGDPTALMPNTTMLEGSQVTPEQLRAACETVPFLAEKRLVIVEGCWSGSSRKAGPLKRNRKTRTVRKPLTSRWSTALKSCRRLPSWCSLTARSTTVIRCCGS